VFTAADDHPSGGADGPVAVISDRFWKRHFAGSSTAVGSSIVLDHIRFTAIGVMPPEFFGAEVGTHPDVWIPISFSDKVGLPGCLNNRACLWLTVVGRMKPGITPPQANAELRSISPASSPRQHRRVGTPPGKSAISPTRFRVTPASRAGRFFGSSSPIHCSSS
jgi:hypothetical protein